MGKTYNFTEMIRRIKEVKKKKGLTNEQLSNLSGVPLGTLNKVFGSETKEPQISTIIKISQALNVSADYIVFGESNNNYPVKLDEDELTFITKYRTLDPRGKETINALIEIECKNSHKYKPAASPANKTVKHEISLYDIPVSAGTGIFLDSSNYEMIDASDAPINASFAVRVSGDSMEPTFYDGDIVYIKQQPVIESGEIGVFMLDGNGYMKKFIRRDDKCFLVSLNPKYDDIELTEYSEFRVYGKVLGKKAK